MSDVSPAPRSETTMNMAFMSDKAAGLDVILDRNGDITGLRCFNRAGRSFRLTIVARGRAVPVTRPGHTRGPVARGLPVHVTRLDNAAGTVEMGPFDPPIPQADFTYSVSG